MHCREQVVDPSSGVLTQSVPACNIEEADGPDSSCAVWMPSPTGLHVKTSAANDYYAGNHRTACFGAASYNRCNNVTRSANT